MSNTIYYLSNKILGNNNKFTIIHVYLSEKNPLSKISILKMHNLTRNDLNEYECRINAADQIDQLKFEIIEKIDTLVTNGQLINQDGLVIKPEILLNPNDQVHKLKIGQRNFKLNCFTENVLGLDQKKYLYTSILKNNVTLLHTDTNEANLILDRVQKSDEGEYKCNFYYLNESMSIVLSKNFQLIVENKHEITYNIDSNLNLYCDLNSNQTVWRRIDVN